MKTFWTDITVESKNMPLYVAQSGDEPKGAVVVLQEAFGVNGHIREVTERIASLGFLAVAPDLFYRQGPRFECGYDELETKAMPRLKAMNNDDYLKDVDQVFAYLNKNFDIGNADTVFVGFCLGGRLTYVTASKRDIGAGVAFYGGGIAAGPIEGTKDIACPMLLFFGGLDTHIPQSDVEKIRLALHQHSVEAEVVTYEKANHGFFCNERQSFQPEAAADAWQRTEEFLNQNLEV